MNRSDYTNCMIPHMKGGGPDRKLRFCIGAKLCSGKAKNEEEARQICINQPAKEPKPRKSKGKVLDPSKLASCISINLSLDGLNQENLGQRLETVILKCGTGKTNTNSSYRRFMNSCLRESPGGGDIRTAQPEIKKCQAQWNAQKES